MSCKFPKEPGVRKISRKAVFKLCSFICVTPTIKPLGRRPRHSADQCLEITRSCVFSASGRIAYLTFNHGLSFLVDVYALGRLDHLCSNCIQNVRRLGGTSLSSTSSRHFTLDYTTRLLHTYSLSVVLRISGRAKNQKYLTRNSCQALSVQLCDPKQASNSLCRRVGNPQPWRNNLLFRLRAAPRTSGRQVCASCSLGGLYWLR